MHRQGTFESLNVDYMMIAICRHQDIWWWRWRIFVCRRAVGGEGEVQGYQRGVGRDIHRTCRILDIVSLVFSLPSLHGTLCLYYCNSLSVRLTCLQLLVSLAAGLGVFDVDNGLTCLIYWNYILLAFRSTDHKLSICPAVFELTARSRIETSHLLLTFRGPIRKFISGCTANGWNSQRIQTLL